MTKPRPLHLALPLSTWLFEPLVVRTETPSRQAGLWWRKTCTWKGFRCCFVKYAGVKSVSLSGSSGPFLHCGHLGLVITYITIVVRTGMLKYGDACAMKRRYCCRWGRVVVIAVQWGGLQSLPLLAGTQKVRFKNLMPWEMRYHCGLSCTLQLHLWNFVLW